MNQPGNYAASKQFDKYLLRGCNCKKAIILDMYGVIIKQTGDDIYC